MHMETPKAFKRVRLNSIHHHTKLDVRKRTATECANSKLSACRLRFDSAWSSVWQLGYFEFNVSWVGKRWTQSKWPKLPMAKQLEEAQWQSEPESCKLSSNIATTQPGTVHDACKSPTLFSPLQIEEVLVWHYHRQIAAKLVVYKWYVAEHERAYTAPMANAVAQNYAHAGLGLTFSL